MIIGISAIKRWPAIRRTIAAMCAAAFLIVTFAHSVEHYSSQQSVGHDVSFSTDGGDQPNSGKVADVDGHCHGCIMLATIDFDARETEKSVHLRAPYIPIGMSRINLPTDIPYPITAI